MYLIFLWPWTSLSLSEDSRGGWWCWALLFPDLGYVVNIYFPTWPLWSSAYVSGLVAQFIVLFVLWPLIQSDSSGGGGVTRSQMPNSCSTKVTPHFYTWALGWLFTFLHDHWVVCFRLCHTVQYFLKFFFWALWTSWSYHIAVADGVVFRSWQPNSCSTGLTPISRPGPWGDYLHSYLNTVIDQLICFRLPKNIYCFHLMSF